jgi:hypothetical protein
MAHLRARWVRCPAGTSGGRDWQALTCLVNSLVNYERLPCGLTDNVLKSNGRQVK